MAFLQKNATFTPLKALILDSHCVTTLFNPIESKQTYIIVKAMICYPNAKINIGLNILSKRSDGYHNLETIFYPINLRDALEIVPAREVGRNKFHLSGFAVEGETQDNLVMKAYSLLNSSYSLEPLDIYLHKAIPHGAGLGGGSSDAAFMLRLLKDYHDLNINCIDLPILAASLGADCPFFIHNKPTFAQGIGNEFSAIKLSLKGYYLLLIKPQLEISTREAYAMITPCQPEIPLTELIRLPVKEWEGKIVNDFESSVFLRYPVISDLKAEMYRMGALYASMSGSGSSVYGIFKKKPEIGHRFAEHFVWVGQLLV